MLFSESANRILRMHLAPSNNIVKKLGGTVEVGNDKTVTRGYP